MSIQSIINISVDFYDKKYIMINAKQYDSNSRWISITCYDQGDLFNLNASKHTAYIRYRKADEKSVLNSCKINYKGEVLVELTEQMLSEEGICYVDLIIVNKGSAIVDIDTGEIITIDNSQIISTMAFCVNVYEATVDNSLIESSDEYNGLNDMLQRADANYKEVIQLAKSYAVGTGNVARENDEQDNSEYYSRLSRSYAVGDANNVRNNENTDNSKYYSELSHASADSAYASETNAKTYMDNANSHMNSTIEYMNTTQSYMSSADSYMKTTKSYMDNANDYMNNTKIYMDNAKNSELSAQQSMDETYAYMESAKNSEISVKQAVDEIETYLNEAVTSANLSKSYAVGNSGVRENEDVDNAHYYYELVKTVVDGLNSGFIPMGTISFSELATAEKATGYVYNIKDDFVTDETFREGSGKSYTAGSNVYYTATGYWDCFGGAASPTATVDEVKDYLGI